MSTPDITAGDAYIYGEYAASGINFTWTGFAQKDSVTLKPIGDAMEDVVGGVTTMEKYSNPGEELSGDFIVTTGDADAVVKGVLISITKPGDEVATKYVVQDASKKYDDVTGAVIVSLTARHRYSMSSAYDTGAIDPDTGSAYAATYRISGFVNVASTGAPLAGVTVSDGTRTADTDSNGYYEIADVPAGTYTLTPTLTDYTFSPTTLSSGAVAANVTGKNFVATAD